MTGTTLDQLIAVRRERDYLRVVVDRIRDLANLYRDEEHIHPPQDGEPECPACWVANLDHALEGHGK